MHWTFAAELRNCRRQRRDLQQAAKVERGAYAPVALGQVRDHSQHRRADHRGYHCHQAVQGANRPECFALAFRIRSAGNDALDGRRDRGAEQIDENDRVYHPALCGRTPHHVSER